MSHSYKTRVLIEIGDTVGGASIEWSLSLDEAPYGIKSFGIDIHPQIITIHYFDEDMKPKIKPLEISSNDVVVNIYPDQGAIIPYSLNIREKPYQLYLKNERLDIR